MHNVSLLSDAQRATLLARAQTEQICGAYYVRLNGELVTPDRPLTSRERGHLVPVTAALAAAAGLAFTTGCAPPPAATPAPVTGLQPVTTTVSATDAAVTNESKDVIVLQAFGMIACDPKEHSGTHGHPAK